jgi:hypothetical protein
MGLGEKVSVPLGATLDDGQQQKKERKRAAR